MALVLSILRPTMVGAGIVRRTTINMRTSYALPCYTITLTWLIGSTCTPFKVCGNDSSQTPSLTVISARSGHCQGRVIPHRFSAGISISIRRASHLDLGGGWDQLGWSCHLDIAQYRQVLIYSFPRPFLSVPDPRVKFGIPIIGCPDFVALMSARAQKYLKPFAPPVAPDSLMAYIRQHDPSNLPFHASDVSNPFLGKKILVLSGGIDTLVPWTASQNFVERLEVGKDGVKKVVVVPDAGHECTTVMVAEAAQFIEIEALKI